MRACSAAIGALSAALLLAAPASAYAQGTPVHFLDGFLAQCTAVTATTCTEPTGSGYGRQPISFNIGALGYSSSLGLPNVGPMGTSTIAGRAVYDSPSAGNLLLVWPLATPLNLSASPDFASISLRYTALSSLQSPLPYVGNFASGTILGTTNEGTNFTAGPQGITILRGTLLAGGSTGGGGTSSLVIGTTAGTAADGGALAAEISRATTAEGVASSNAANALTIATTAQTTANAGVQVVNGTHYPASGSLALAAPDVGAPTLAQFTAAVSGSAIVSGHFGGSYTLVAAEYGVATVIVRDALTSNETLIVPNNWKANVENQTTGSYSVTIATAAGTGIAVPQGGVQTLVADGTNVVSPTSSPPGQATASTAGVIKSTPNLAISGTDGSGNNIAATITFGTAAGTFAQGNDSRIVGAFQTSAAGPLATATLGTGFAVTGGAAGLATFGPGAGTYGDATHTNSITFDATGRASAISQNLITPAGIGAPNATNPATIYTASGAIALTDVRSIVNNATAGTTLAMTIANDTVDGRCRDIKKLGAGTVTLAGTFDGASSPPLTFNTPAQIKESVLLCWNVAISSYTVE